jgi:hypothetical protein
MVASMIRWLEQFAESDIIWYQDYSHMCMPWCQVAHGPMLYMPPC